MNHYTFPKVKNKVPYLPSVYTLNCRCVLEWEILKGFPAAFKALRWAKVQPFFFACRPHGQTKDAAQLCKASCWEWSVPLKACQIMKFWPSTLLDESFSQSPALMVKPRMPLSSSSILEGDNQNLRLINYHFSTFFSHFFVIVINITNFIDIQTIILRCWTGLWFYQF